MKNNNKRRILKLIKGTHHAVPQEKRLLMEKPFRITNGKCWLLRFIGNNWRATAAENINFDSLFNRLTFIPHIYFLKMSLISQQKRSFCNSSVPVQPLGQCWELCAQGHSSCCSHPLPRVVMPKPTHLLPPVFNTFALVVHAQNAFEEWRYIISTRQLENKRV